MGIILQAKTELEEDRMVVVVGGPKRLLSVYEEVVELARNGRKGADLARNSPEI